MAPLLSTRGATVAPNGSIDDNDPGARVIASVPSLHMTRGLAIKMFDDFLHYLADHGVMLTELSREESFAITKRWTSVFAANLTISAKLKD